MVREMIMEGFRWPAEMPYDGPSSHRVQFEAGNNEDYQQDALQPACPDSTAMVCLSAQTYALRVTISGTVIL